MNKLSNVVKLSNGVDLSVNIVLLKKKRNRSQYTVYNKRGKSSDFASDGITKICHLIKKDNVD